MFDLFQIRLPQKAQGFVHSLQEKPKSGSLISAFILGILASLVVSPCTSAPLISVLGLIAQSGDWVLGGLSLFTLAIGMGIPLILIGSGVGYLVPKAGHWMNDLKYLLGVLMLLVASWLLARIIPDSIALIIYAIILIGYTIFLGLFNQPETKLEKIKKVFSIVILLYGICLFIGSMMGNSSLIRPLAISTNISSNNTQENAQIKESTSVVKTSYKLNKLINQYSSAGKRIVLDFYASWCTECQILSNFLQTQQSVDLLKKNNIQLIKVNASKYSDESNQMLQEYKVIGFPTLILLDSATKKPKRYRSGSINFEQLKKLIQQ